MTIRAETTAATRSSLLAAASALLDEGGVDAVTLRAVGEGAAVSRSAAYRHFADKEAMLDAIGDEAWADLAARLGQIAEAEHLAPAVALRAATEALADVASTRPHRYRLMLTKKSGGTAGAAASAHRHLFDLVARVAPQDRAELFAGLLIATIHGIADLEASGLRHLHKPSSDRERIVDLLIEVMQGTEPPARR